MKKLIFLLIMLPASVWTQQLYHNTQYYDIYSFFNPAYTGVQDVTQITSTYKKYIAGFEGSPQSYMLLADSKVDAAHLGIGGYVMNNQIGIVNNTKAMLNLNYQLEFETSKISFGMRGGYEFYNANFEKIVLADPDDQEFYNAIDNKAFPVFGAGVVFSTEKLKVGISAPKLFNVKKDKVDNVGLESSPSLLSHYMAFSEYTFDISEKVSITPSGLLKYIPGHSIHGDISVRTNIANLLTVGVSYRTPNALNAILQFNIKNFMKIGYSFDYALAARSAVNTGSHEAQISFFINKKEKVKNEE